jgi:hypothetical protein
MTTLSDAFEREQPSFEDITLYQLCYWKVTGIYGLTQEEIETLITNPDPQTPSHHQVDLRIIKAYLMGESVPTYLPGHLLSRHFGILPMYLPRDQFLPSELVVPLIDAQYHWDYCIWKHRLDANKRATDFLVDHLRDPLLTISQVIEAPVCTPFIPTVRAAELRWWNGYFNTYHSFDDLILLGGHYQNSFTQRAIRTVLWHTGKSAQDIYAMALTILQVGLLTIQLPPNPDFNSLSPEEKDRIYQDLHNQIDSLNLWSISFAHIALLCGDTGPALESGLANQELVIAFLCRFQVILLHGYINFPTIDDLRQRLLNQYLRIGLEGDSRVLGPPDHPFQTVREGSSWEGGRPIQLPLIPQDSTIANNYRQYQDSEGIEMDSVRNPPRPAKRPRLGSFTSDSLFNKDSELSEGSEHTELTLPLLDADHCNKTIVMDTFYGNKQHDEE